MWISEQDVDAVLSLEDAIAALEQGLRREARGESVALAKTHATWGRGNTLHAIGAVFLRVLGPLLGLVPADAVHASHDETAVSDGRNRRLNDLAALLIGRRTYPSSIQRAGAVASS